MTRRECLGVLGLLTSCDDDMFLRPGIIGSRKRITRQLGVLVNENFTGGSLPAGFTAVGSPTLSFPGTGMSVSGGSGTFTKRIIFAPWHNLEEWDMEITFTLNSTINTTSYGLGIGVQTTFNPWENRSVLTRYIATTGNGAGTDGKDFMDFGTAAQTDGPTGYANRSTSASALTAVNGRSYTMRFSRTKGTNVVYNATVIDNSNSSTITNSVTESLAASQLYYANGTGRFVIYVFGGTQLVTNFKITAYDYYDVENVFVGDSITHGLGATNLTGRFASNVLPFNASYSVSAGPSDICEQLENKTQSIITLNPRIVFLMMGGNDVTATTIPTATWQAQYKSFCTQVKAAGIRVVHLYATPRSTDITSVNTFISTESDFTNDLKIDTYTPLWSGSGTSLNAAYNSGDGIHPNQAGHDLIAATIKANRPL